MVIRTESRAAALPFLAFAALVAALTGCGTVYNVTKFLGERPVVGADGDTLPSLPQAAVFGGVRQDAQWIENACSRTLKDKTTPWNSFKEGSCEGAYFFFVDLPLCIAMDIACLPFTLPAASFRRR